MQAGSFGYVVETRRDGTYLVSSWEACRETFQKESAGLRVFMFCHKPGKGPNIAALIDRVERQVHANPRTVMGPTQYDKVSYVRTSSWWMKDEMRRSLLTALLRVGQHYDPDLDNLDETLSSHRYTRRTLPAIQRFLNGYTRYTGKVEGWYRQFFENGKYRGTAPPTEADLREMLVRP